MKNVLARGSVVLPDTHTSDEITDALRDLEECAQGRRTVISCKTATLCSELLELAKKGRLVTL